MLLHTEPQILRLSGAEPEKVGLGHISQFLFLSLRHCPSFAQLYYWKSSWCSPHIPVRALILHETVLLCSHSFCTLRFPLPHSTLIFVFFLSKPKLVSSKLYQHFRIFRRVFIHQGVGKVKDIILSTCVKQQSDHQCQNRKATAGPGHTKLKKLQPKARQGHQSALCVLAYNDQFHRPKQSTVLTKHCFQRGKRKHPRILIKELHRNINRQI